VFNEVPELYDRVRPGYPAELFADLTALTGLTPESSILEVGCGTGQATVPLAQLGSSIAALEPGEGMAALARQRLSGTPNVVVEGATFEEWDPQDRRFDLLVAAASWHWIDPEIGWRKAHSLLTPDGWMAILGNVVYQPLDGPEMYAETADLHQRFAPDNPDWGHPPTEAAVRATSQGWGPPNQDTEGFFGETTVRWYPQVKWFDGEGMVDHLRSMSPYRRLDESTREPLLAAIADRIRTQLDDRIGRHYLSVLRIGQVAAT